MARFGSGFSERFAMSRPAGVFFGSHQLPESEGAPSGRLVEHGAETFYAIERAEGLASLFDERGKRGSYCGDGKVDSPNEECDDSVNLSQYGGCAPGCNNGPKCGDGRVQAKFGEQCDDGMNLGGYEQCAPGCKLGPRCGDGVIQAKEQCDVGNA
jgi:hypothetical protein